MKIAFFTETWYPNVDGVVVALSNTKERIEKLKNEIVVFAAGTPDLKKRRKTKDVYIFPSVDFIPYPTYKIAIFPYPDAEDIAKKEKVEVIHSHGMGPMGLAALYVASILNKPLVGTLHTNIQEATHYVIPIKPMQKIMKSMAWKYLRWYYNQCDKTIVPSEYMKKECEANGIRNVVAISNGIDVERFKPGNKTIWLDRTVILYTGRLVKEKNLEVVIKAAHLVKKEVPNALFVVIGNGPMEQAYKEMAKKHKVDDLFIFINGVKHKDIVQYYQNADVFAFPSMFETQGLSCLEALACGLPVAGADYLAIPDLVRNDYNGYLFKPHNARECANAIVRCVGNRRRLGRNAVKSAQGHSIEKSVNRQLAIYHELLNMPCEV